MPFWARRSGMLLQQIGQHSVSCISCVRGGARLSDLGQCHVCIDDTSRIHSAHERRGARTHTLPHNAGSKRPLLKTCAVRLGSRPCPPGVWRRRDAGAGEREARVSTRVADTLQRAPHAARGHHMLPAFSPITNHPSIEHRHAFQISRLQDGCGAVVGPHSGVKCAVAVDPVRLVMPRKSAE